MSLIGSTNCNVVTLPPLVADICNADTNFGQIRRIFIAQIGNPFADVTDPDEWASRVSNDSVATNAIRMLHVIGDKPQPERTELEISMGRKLFTAPKHTVNVKIDETGEENYDFIQLLDGAPAAQFLMWFEAGKYMYGGDSGIIVNITLDDVIPESDEELEIFQGVATWEGAHPDRVISPIS